MNWQNSDDLFSQEETKMSSDLNPHDSEVTSIEELERMKYIQLQKFQEPANNTQRQALISIITHFGELLINNNLEQIIKTLLTNDCEIFLFSSTGRPPVLCTLHPEGLYDLFNGIQVQERVVRETYVDLEKSTVIQFCNIRVLYGDEESPVEEITSEIFTIKENRISRYRASFAHMTPAHGGIDPFELTKKDKVLARLKQINYALADQLDLRKVASFFDEHTQYKVWSWETQKCFTFGKRDFAENFRKLEESLVIKCIVPYEIFTDSQFAVATYVYHLEGISGQYANRKYIWPNTCVYAFDQDLKIIKISQQGELHLEGEIKIPFEIYSRERIIEKNFELSKNAGTKPNLDVLYNDSVQMTCSVCKFGPESLPDVGIFNTLDKGRKMIADLEKGQHKLEWSKIVDIYVDHGDPSFDVSISLTCNEGILSYPGYPYSEKYMDFLAISKLSFENGKLAKVIAFYSDIPEQVPSFFDDPGFEATNIKRKDGL